MIAQAMKANAKGFTLVELIVVITILAILATIGFLSLQGYTSDAKQTKTVANLRTVGSSLVNEQAITGNSFSTYVNANSAYTMSGATGYATSTIYGNSFTGVVGAGNYAVGDLNANALKIDGNKFFDKTSTGYTVPFAVASATFSESVNNTTRQRSLFQIAATLKGATGSTGLVEGTYAAGTGVNDLNGLIKSNGGASTTTGITNGGANYPYAL